MGNFREEYDILKGKIYNRFSELLNQQEQGLVFAEDDENYDDCDIVDVVDEVNGGTYSVYVVGITKGGMIECRDLEDGRRDEYKLSDVSDLYGKITIVELLEHYSI